MRLLPSVPFSHCGLALPTAQSSSGVPSRDQPELSGSPFWRLPDQTLEVTDVSPTLTVVTAL